MEHVRAEGCPTLRLVILSSDTLPDTDYRRLIEDFGETTRVVNCYG